MINSRKHQILTVLLLTGLCTTTFAAEANPPKPELKFEISTKETKWIGLNGQPGRGTIKPKYVATLFIKDDYCFSGLSDSGRKDVLLRTSAGESMSVQQKAFFAKSKDTVRITQGKGAKYYLYCRLYAVSQDDAKKMAAALIEALNTPQARRRLYKRKVRQLASYKSDLANRDTRMEFYLARFREKNLKDVPYLTIEEAKRTISELNKMLNIMVIDRAGIKAKLKAIEKQQQRKEVINTGALLKLEEMNVDQAVELNALESKIQTASELRKQAKDFYKKMSDKQLDLKQHYLHLGKEVEENELELRRIEKILANPKSEIPPVRVNKNTVTIYPVKSDG